MNQISLVYDAVLSAPFKPVRDTEFNKATLEAEYSAWQKLVSCTPLRIDHLGGIAVGFMSGLSIGGSYVGNQITPPFSDHEFSNIILPASELAIQKIRDICQTKRTVGAAARIIDNIDYRNI